jgi:anti-anti-sigma factor
MHVVADSSYAQIYVEGRLDVHSVADVRDAMHTAIDRGSGDLVLDLGDAEVMDATGLGVLVGAHRRAQRAGRRLVLRRVSPRLSRLLLATRLHRVLHLERAIDLETALLVTA